MANPRKVYTTKFSQETIDALTECCGADRGRALEFAANALVAIMNDSPRHKMLIMQLANANQYPEAEVIRVLMGRSLNNPQRK